MKISIILPAYNAASTISRMLDSLLCQTMKDFEILAIDDGSTDETGNILDAYAQRDARVIVFHKQNEGVAMARQLGVDNARGEYSIHADADDWVEPTMLEELYAKAKAEDADMVIADFYSDQPDGKTVLKRQSPTHLNTPQQLDDIFFGGFFSALWNKLIRHSIYKQYNVRFFPEVNYCEDVLVCVQIMLHHNLHIVHHPKPFYHYFVNQTSITREVTRKTFLALSAFREKTFAILTDDKYKHIRDQITKSIFVSCFSHKNVMTADEISYYAKLLIPVIMQGNNTRFKIGILLIRLRLYAIARYLIHY